MENIKKHKSLIQQAVYTTFMTGVVLVVNGRKNLQIKRLQMEFNHFANRYLLSAFYRLSMGSCRYSATS